jgi:predicted ATPase/DNA-binding SARP family transcriptional activator
VVPVRVEVLGPLRLVVDGAPVDVPGHRRRAALALLALAGGRVVTADALVDALWPDDPPDTGQRALHSHISRLRRHLGPAAPRLERAGAGYRLRLDPDDVDATRLRRLAARCAGELREAAPTAARTAADALALWRGQALAEFADVPPLAAEAAGLRELYLQVRDDALEARLAADDGTVTSDAAAAAADEPLRERTVTLLMRALAREGRAGDALAAGAAYRRHVTEETGLDPGPGIAALEQRIAAGELASTATEVPAAGRPAGPADPAGPAGPADQAGLAPRPLARPGGPMVGRDHDAEELRRLLGTQRLVTVTGPGGVGKTRLSLDVVADLTERGAEAALVTLAEVTEGARVAGAVVTALRLRIGGDTTPDAVAHALAERPLLLLLDNCEHVAPACRDLVAALLRRAPGVRVLATSRVTLHVPGEYVVRLQPLTGQPAVRAFVEHARRRDPAFALAAADADAVAEVVRRIDGLPLAIELAAGQLAVLPPAALRDRLGRALDALSAERPAGDERHRTLRTTIDWSYRLLADGERALLRALATFPGGADLATVETLAARAMPGTDPLVALRRLVDASLVSPDGRDGRYTILETVRAFLLEDAAARGEREAADREFLAWALRTARSLGEALSGPDTAAADRRLRAELANLRAARDLARARGDVDLVIDVTLSLDEAVAFRNLEELWHWSVELAADPAVRGHAREAAVLGSATEAAWLAGDLPQAERLRALALAAAERTTDPGGRRRCWGGAAAVSLFLGRFDEARRYWEDAASVAGQPAQQLASASLAATYGGDPDGALGLVRRALDAVAARPCPTDLAFVRYAEGEALAGSDPVAAETAYTTAIEVARSCGVGFVEGVAMVGLASVWTATGDLASAVRGYLALLDYWNRTGNATQLWTTIRNVARLLRAHDLDADAAILLAAAAGAASASRLTGEDAVRAEQEEASLEERLGAAATAELRARARGLTAAAASAIARDALGRVPVAAR